MAARYCSRSLASICCDLQPRRLRSRFCAKNLNLENMRTVACEKLVGFPDRKSEGNHGIADDNGFFVHEQYLPPMLNSLEESNPPDDDFSASPHCGVAIAVMRVWGSWLRLNYRCMERICRHYFQARCHCIRPRRSFQCQSTPPCEGDGQRARLWWW